MEKDAKALQQLLGKWRTWTAQAAVAFNSEAKEALAAAEATLIVDDEDLYALVRDGCHPVPVDVTISADTAIARCHVAECQRQVR